MVRMRTWLSAYLLVAFATATHAEPMRPDLAARLEAMHKASGAPAMVAVVVDGERTYTGGINANERSLVRINSLTKLMTGELLATLIAQGRVRLDDTLQTHAPERLRVPIARGARAVTLKDLAAHVSGLPRDLPPAMSERARWRWLSRFKPRRAPGGTAEYSNAAYTFLGDALSNAAGASYETLLRRHITGPLALADTTLNPSPSQCERLLPATHPCMPTYQFAAMGGLYSTASDMARWMQAELDAPPNTPSAAAQNAIVARTELKRVLNLDMAGPMDAVAMGWLRMRLGGVTVLQKTGGGGGFMNYVVLAPSARKGLFITVNRVDIPMLRRLTRAANALMVEELL
jgi:D-alanyl-D-alanine-carboxypeptidase/D-alanyl-D-alanine-endopeptidase